MNVFYLHHDPKECAQMHCDSHSSKMCVEYAQLLSTAHRVIDGKLWYGRTTNGRRIARDFHPDPEMQQQLYLASHVNHPSNIWVRENASNYEWLYDMWIELGKEYSHRYGREHASITKLELDLLVPPINIEQGEFTQPTPAMKSYPHCIVEGDSQTSYRNFYFEDKQSFAKWTNRAPPGWWMEKINAEQQG